MTLALTGRILRQQRFVLIALVLGVFGMELLIVHIAAAFGPTMVQLFESLPPLFRSFIGAQLSELSLTSFVGFGFQHPATFAMCLALVVMTATIPAAERETGMLDLLLAHPLSRWSYLSAILIALGLGSFLLPLAGLCGAAVGIAMVEVPDEPLWTDFIPSALGLSALLLAWGGIALLLATFGRRRGTAIARCLGAIVTLFMIETFSSLWAPLENLAWVSPFHYFTPISSAVSSFEWTNPSILVGIFTLTTAFAFQRFSRHDL